MLESLLDITNIIPIVEGPGAAPVGDILGIIANGLA